MCAIYSNILEKEGVDFFDGALQTGFTTPWIPGLSDATQGADLLSKGCLQAFSLFQQSTGAAVPVDQESDLRSICYSLLSRIPAEGLQELIEAMVEIWAAYESLQHQAPTTSEPKKVKATLRKREVRASFPIAEDDV